MVDEGGDVVVVVDVVELVVVVEDDEVVVLDGDVVVVVEVVVVVGVGVTKLQTAAAQSCGCVAMTTSSPGRAEKVHTESGGPVARQARAGSSVAKLVRVPTSWAVPEEGVDDTGASETGAPVNTAVEVKPVPGMVVGVVEAGPGE